MRPRSLARRLALQYLFMIDVGGEAGAPPVREFLQDQEYAVDAAAAGYACRLVDLVARRRREIDRLLAAALRNWELGRVAPVELNVMRLSAGELLARAVPPRVALDEAIKLAKKFGGRDSGAFVNGVLDRVLQDLEQVPAAGRPVRERS